MSNTDTKCPLPWMHTSIQTSGALRSCCIASDLVRHDGDIINIKHTSLSEAINSSSMQELRDSMRRGEKHSNCSTCWKDEENGKISKRMYETAYLKDTLKNTIQQGDSISIQQHNTLDYDSEPTRYLDIQLGVGNVCNLKCRTCSPYCSTKWIDEFKHRTGEQKYEFNNLEVDKSITDSKFWEELDDWSSTVKRLEIMGGEPFYMKEFHILIDKLIANGNSKHITLAMSTNGTIFNEKLCNKIRENFKSLGLNVSIDGIGKHFDFLRHGNNWDKVKKNLDGFYEMFQKHQNFNMGATITISQINMYYIREIHEFFEQNYPDIDHGTHYSTFNIFNNIIHYPSYYSSNTMPADLKEHYLHKIKYPSNYGLSDWNEDKFQQQIQPLINHVLTPTSYVDWRDFIRETNSADQYRNENFQETFPELWEMFKPYWHLMEDIKW